MSPLVAAIELGGTKSLAVLARGRTILDRVVIPTRSPVPTLATLTDRIASWHVAEAVAAIGIATFGPIILARGDPAFGRIATTPKLGWSHFDVRGAVASRFALPIGLDTDVAGAALAEGRWGAAQGCSDHVYMTIGTGVGAGVVAHDRIVHGRGHPEVGHLRVRRVAGDSFVGSCPFHGDCLEGLVAGPALAARTGLAADMIADDHPVWANVAAELAEAMAILIFTLAPERILLGGGIMCKRPLLLAHVLARTGELMAEYVARSGPLELSRTILLAGLGEDVGPLGAVALGERALSELAYGGTFPRISDNFSQSR